MKTRLTCWLLASIAWVAAIAQPTTADWAVLSKRLIDETAGIKAGQYVVLMGGKHTLPLLEQLGADLHRKGAHPLVVMETDAMLRALLREKPEANLSDLPSHLLALMNTADYAIILPNSENYKKINEGLDPRRSALMGQVTEKFLAEVSKNKISNTISLDFPSREVAETGGIDYGLFEKMHWAAMATDYKKVESIGTRLQHLLHGARQVKITTKAGTSLSFAMGNRLVFTDDGILSDKERASTNYYERYASLPGGWMDFAPDESTVNGTVVIAKARCAYGPMTDVNFTVKNGLMENFKAKTGQDCFEREMQPHTGDKYMVSGFTIGLNPELKVMESGQANFRPIKAAGYITLMIGSNNTPYNGKVVATGGYTLPLTNATLEINGQVVIRDGKIEM